MKRNLSPMEKNLLTHLESTDRIFTMQDLRERLYGGYCSDTLIRVLIHQIRQKKGAEFIETVQGRGYRLHTPILRHPEPVVLQEEAAG